MTAKRGRPPTVAGGGRVAMRLDADSAAALATLTTTLRVSDSEAARLALVAHAATVAGSSTPLATETREVRRLATVIDDAVADLQDRISALEVAAGLVRDEGSRVDEQTAAERFPAPGQRLPRNPR